MLQGFPKATTQTMVSPGHYRISRDDGYEIEVRREAKGRWYNIDTGKSAGSLREWVYDMQHGYTAHDQVQSTFSERGKIRQ